MVLYFDFICSCYSHLTFLVSFTYCVHKPLSLLADGRGFVFLFYFFLSSFFGENNCLVLKFWNRCSKKNTIDDLLVGTAASVVWLLFFITYFLVQFRNLLPCMYIRIGTHCTTNEMNKNVNKMCDTHTNTNTHSPIYFKGAYVNRFPFRLYIKIIIILKVTLFRTSVR